MRQDKTGPDILVRPETSVDRSAIRRIIEAAFDQPDEADLVEALRSDGVISHSLVAVDHGQIIGHLALSSLKSPDRALALAPVSVLPSHQNCEIGSTLIMQSLELARSDGFDLVFVLGNPRYYSRFGFSVETAKPFPCPFAGPHFMAQWLNEFRFLQNR